MSRFLFGPFDDEPDGDLDDEDGDVDDLDLEDGYDDEDCDDDEWCGDRPPLPVLFAAWEFHHR